VGVHGVTTGPSVDPALAIGNHPPDPHPDSLPFQAPRSNIRSAFLAASTSASAPCRLMRRLATRQMSMSEIIVD
jgi:hypothetical protein